MLSLLLKSLDNKTRECRRPVLIILHFMSFTSTDTCMDETCGVNNLIINSWNTDEIGKFFLFFLFHRQSCVCEHWLHLQETKHELMTNFIMQVLYWQYFRIQLIIFHPLYIYMYLLEEFFVGHVLESQR